MNDPAPQVRLGIDIGGTFIDYAVTDTRTGEVRFEKQPATAGALVDEFMAGLARLELRGSDIVQLFHGTTVAINAVVQERGARVALVTTKGFRDVLELGRGGRRDIYDLRYAPASPLVDASLRFELPERLTHDGKVLIAIEDHAVETLIEDLRAADVDAVAVCFLHSYANPMHENVVVEAIENALPGVLVTPSHAVTAEWHEFERTSTTVVNAYVRPLFSSYLQELASALDRDGYTGTIGIMQSNGGVLTANRASELPVRTLMSGPAGGVVACRRLAQEIGIEHAICADVGGTTFDVALILDGDLVEKHATEIGGRPVLGSMVDITSVGAGGGSIAWIDDRGFLKVGPQSAGSMPGPVCFGKGGRLPTVTDAQVLLGRLDPEEFLGGRMKLDVDAAREAFERHLCEPLGLDVTEIALGVLRIAETNMTNAIRAITVQRGLDPRDFTLISYGGGGGLFSVFLAEEMGVTSVIAPAGAANFSAWGILSSDYREDAVRTRVLPLGGSAGDLIVEFASLASEVREAMRAYQGPGTGVEVAYSADVRFLGQHHTVAVSVDEGSFISGDALVDEITRGFRREHDRIYGPRTHDSQLEVVTVRARGTIGVVEPRIPATAAVAAGSGPKKSRSVYFGPEQLLTDVYDLQSLAAGQVLPGPVVIDEVANTILVPPGWEARKDGRGNLLIDRVEEGGSAS